MPKKKEYQNNHTSSSIPGDQGWFAFNGVCTETSHNKSSHQYIESMTHGVFIVSSLVIQLLSPSLIVKDAEEAVAPVLSRMTSIILVPVSSIRSNI